MINYTSKIAKSKQIKNKIAKHFEEVEIFKRKRKFQNNKILSRILLNFIATGISLFTLSIVCKTSEKIDISDTSLKKLFQKSDKFKEIYENLLNSRENTKSKSKKVLGFKQCFLLDTTSLKEEGQIGEVYRIHSSYAITKNQISSVNVTDSHTAESVKNFKINKNSLYLADRAYCTASQMTYMIENNAEFIFRMKYNGVKLYSGKNCDKRFDLVEYISASKRNYTSKTVYIKYGDKVSKIKIVAKRLGEEVTQSNRKAVLKKAQKRGDVIRPETLKMCEWLILATSLADKSNESILRTYRLRWQIELLFKRFKTFINLRKIRKSTSNYAFSYIFLALIYFFALELFVDISEPFFENLKISSVWTKLSVAVSFTFAFS